MRFSALGHTLILSMVCIASHDLLWCKDAKSLYCNIGDTSHLRQIHAVAGMLP